MTSKFLNISTDTTLGGSGASDETVSSQKAVKAYVDAHSGGGGGGSYTAGTGIDITSNTISVTAPTLTNTATGTNSLTILGYATSQQGCVNIGISSATNNSTFATAIGQGASIGNNAGSSVVIGSGAYVTTNSQNATAIGGSSNCRAERAVAIGYSASARASYAIQLGYGTNSEANSFYVATSSSNNWKMLGSDGKIPAARLPIAAHVVETYSNGADWYRVWSDGWCEQGGFAAGNSSNYDTTVTLLKAYANTNYNIACCLVGKNVTSSHSYDYGYVANVSTSDFHLRTFKTSEGSGGYWQASGYIS